MYCGGLSRSSSSKISARAEARTDVAAAGAGTVNGAPHEAHCPCRPAIETGKSYCAPQPGHETALNFGSEDGMTDVPNALHESNFPLPFSIQRRERENCG